MLNRRVHLTKCLATFKAQNDMRATWVWLLARGRAFSDERVDDDGYQGKNQEKVNHKTSNVNSALSPLHRQLVRSSTDLRAEGCRAGFPVLNEELIIVFLNIYLKY
jgi:hypothetical protein